MQFRRFGLAAIVAVSVGSLVLSNGDLPVLQPLFGSAAYAADQSGTAKSGGFGNGSSGLGSSPAATSSGTSSSSSSTRSATAGQGATQPVDKAVDRIGLGNGTSSQTPPATSSDTAGTGTAATTQDAATSKDASSTTTVTKDDQSTVQSKAAVTSLAATAAATPDAPPVSAPAKPSTPDIGSNGSLTQDIAIDVPQFHGLEPKLSLHYDSMRKSRTGGLYQGLLGYGWGIDGIDVIERASPGYGAPLFTSSDVFLLDGEQMVGCTSGMTASPSCTTGGTHATQIENYKRIAFNSATNEWTVWDRDGTASTFRSIAALAGTNPAAGSADENLQKNARWLLARKTDTHGNTVNYNWTCPDLPVCVPASVTYGNAAIGFTYANRPDWISVANGLSVSTIKYRIAAFSVYANVSTGLFRGGYRLSYDQSAFSGVSRLTEVDRFGKDVVFDGTGNISGGTGKPIRKMAYDDVNYAYTTYGGQNFQAANESKGSVVNKQVGDLNFDGRDEIYGPVATTGSVQQGGGSSGTTTYYNYLQWELTNFTVDGHIAATHTMFSSPIATQTSLPAPVAYTFPGRYVGGYMVKDFGISVVTAGTQSQGSHGTSTVYNTSAYIAAPNGDFSLGSGVCPIATFAAACNGMPVASNATAPATTSGMVSGDANAIGYDTLYNVPAGVIGTYGYILGMADLAGNGHQSVIVADTQSAQVKIVNLVNGSWTTTQTLPINCKAAATTPVCALGDVNGDGTTDLVRVATGSGYQLDVWLSSGSTFVNVVNNLSQPGTPILRDFDNDGKVDIITANGRNFDNPFQTMFAYSLRYSNAGWGMVQSPLSKSGSALVGDFNGDGLPDFVDSTTSVAVSAPGAGNPNLLRNVTLETGGIVSVNYAPSSQWTNGYMPQVLHAVASITMNDGRGTAGTTSYAYSGGLYDPVARKFLGYRTIAMTKPLANGETTAPTVTTTYRQDLASYGLPDTIVSNDGTANKVKTVTEGYSGEFTNAPYRAQNTSTTTTLQDGQTVTTQVTRAFDIYNNITDIRDYGRTDVSGDELWNQYGFAINTSAYIVSKPVVHRERNNFSDSDQNNYLSGENLYYDNNPNLTLNQPPTKGDLTTHWDYTAFGANWNGHTQTFAYDTYGNKTVEVDGAGDRTEWDFDTTYHLYPVKEREPKYFANGAQPADTRYVSTTAYDYACGLPSAKTDPNGIVDSLTYDSYCRPSFHQNSGTNYQTTTNYENEGNPTSQAVAVWTIAYDGNSAKFDRIRYDGLARPWRNEDSGDANSSAMRLTDTVYDARGNKMQVSVPRFDGDAVLWDSNLFDWQDRIVKTIHPDVSYRSYYYRASSLNLAASTSSNIPQSLSIVTDEEGFQHAAYTDGWGNDILIQDYNGTAWLSEYRSYDGLHRLSAVKDRDGATWTYTYDLAGNRLTASDPDLGNWSYAYDGANRLTSQTDARGAVSTLSYDQLGRVVLQQSQLPGGPVVTGAQNTYDQNFNASSRNIGMLTTAVSPAATKTFDRSYTGSGTVLTTATTIDGLTQTTTENRNRIDTTASLLYAPVNVAVGTSAAPWTYNADNLLATIPGRINSISYEADFQTRAITYANGVTTNFTYDPNRRWLTRVTTLKGATVILDNQYTRDKLGRIKTITGANPNENWTYTYDNLARLATATNAGNGSLNETYTYSNTGNLLSRSRFSLNYTYPAGTAVRPHAATQIGSQVIGYDANGNMLTDGSRTLVWDGANRLSTVTKSGSTVTLTYGPDGARAKKTYAFGTTLYPSADVEIDRTTPGVNLYTFYPHPDLKITANQSTGAVANFYLHRDHLNSVRQVTDASGNITEQTGYSAWGERMNTAFATQKGYIGERFDPETGLMYLNARYYDPMFARFIPRDEHTPSEATQKLARDEK